MVQPGKAEGEIKAMRASLTRWLDARSRLTAIAAGTAPASKMPREQVAEMLAQRDWAVEQRLALNLHRMLSEMFDSATLPSPDVKANPDAAADLAAIAVSGKLPTESGAPQAQGLIWLWPAVVVVGLVMFTIVSKIKSDADIAKDEMEKKCIMAGACVDSGFWMKAAALTVLGWLVWTQFGGKELAGRGRRVAVGNPARRRRRRRR